MKISNRVGYFGISVAFIVLWLDIAEAIFCIYHLDEKEVSCLWIMYVTAMLSFFVFIFCRHFSNALE